MQKYDSYKDSGVQWLGEIPSHWTIMPLKYSGRFCKGKLPSNTNDNCLGKPIIGASEMNGNMPSVYSEDNSVPQCTQNDILFLWDGANAGLVSSFHDGIVASTVTKFTCDNSNIVSTYLYYLEKNYQRYYKERVGGTTIPHMNSQYIASCPLLIPSIQEQQAIANYLDTITTKIDEAIAQQQKMIDLLNERKQIIINRAVTKGLNPNALMKDSGVEWIGEVPEHWDAVRIKYLLNEKKERSQTGSEEPLSMSQKHGLIPTKDMDIVPNMASSFVGAKIVNKGNLVFNKLKAHLGVFATSEYEGLVSPDYAVYEGTGLADLKFLEYIFKTPKCIAEFVKLITGVGAGLSRLYTGDLYSIYIPLPPCQEQTNIVEHIEASTRNIKTAINNAEQQIALLQERKQIIINDVVTGKVKII